jgi:hypothetical protein
LQTMLYNSESIQTSNSTQTWGDLVRPSLGAVRPPSGFVPDRLQRNPVRPPLRPGLTGLGRSDLALAKFECQHLLIYNSYIGAPH